MQRCNGETRCTNTYRQSSTHISCLTCTCTRSTDFFSSARSRLTSRVPPCCASLVRSIHRLVSALLPVGRPFGTSRPNTLACGLRKRPGSFLIGSHYRDSQYIHIRAKAFYVHNSRNVAAKLLKYTRSVS